MSELELYWSEIVNLKRDAIYMSLYADRNETIDRWIEGFQAIAGVTSLGSWAYFKAYPEVWSAIIVLSQILSAVRDQFPFRKRVKALVALHYDLNRIALAAEKDYFRVRSGLLSDRQIHTLRMSYRADSNASIAKHFDGTIMISRLELVRRADILAKDYFANYLSTTNSGLVQ